MPAIVSGHRDFSAPRVRTYDGRRSRVLVARTVIRASSAGPPDRVSPRQSPFLSGWGGVRQAPGVRSYADRRVTAPRTRGRRRPRTTDNFDTRENTAMAVVTMRQLLESGVHFGHQTRRWNPKMKRFIMTERNGIYIIDLQQSLTYINNAYEFVKETVAHGGSILFV